MRWDFSVLREEESGGDSGGGAAPEVSKPASSSGLLDGVNWANGGQNAENGSEVDQKPNPAQGSTPPAKATPEGKQTDYKPFSIYEDGKVSEKFLQTLSDEDKGLAKFFGKYAGAKDPEKAMLQGVKNLQYLAGQKALEPLPDDAPDSVKDERRQLMAKLNGVPETPEGYGIKKPETLPDGVYWPEESVGAYAGIFHKHNASPELVKEILELHTKTLEGAEVQIEQQITAQRTEEMGKLKTEFGDRTNQVLTKAMRGAMTLGLTEDEAKALGTSAASIKALAKVVDLVSEDRLAVDAGAGSNVGGSYREKALDIVTNPNNPLHKAYHDTGHPKHEEAVAQRSELNRKWHATKRTV